MAVAVPGSDLKETISAIVQQGIEQVAAIPMQQMSAEITLSKKQRQRLENAARKPKAKAK